MAAAHVKTSGTASCRAAPLDDGRPPLHNGDSLRTECLGSGRTSCSGRREEPGESHSGWSPTSGGELLHWDRCPR
eukprot:13314091-Alexandrium_andersonii.AAC.1